MSNFKENRHSVLIETAGEGVLDEIVRWGESVWWPKDSLMRFKRLGRGLVAVGTLYRQKVLLPFAPSWDAEVTALSERGITRKFLNGVFEGQETVSFKKAQGHLIVDYLMHYRVKGTFNRILWDLFFRKLHDRNIETILANLKKYIENEVNNN